MKITRLFSKMRLRLQEPTPTAPESYWIQRESDVMGLSEREQPHLTRQADTYNAIFRAIKARSLAQVVDLGCNIATLGSSLYYWGYSGSYIGVDSNPYALDEAGKSLTTVTRASHLVCANIRALPFAQRSFPCVVMKDVLEHMEDFRPFLREVSRVSSKYVIISNFIPWTEGKAIVRYESPGFYHNLYNRHEVYAFAQELGLEVEEVLSALEKDARPNEVVVFARAKGSIS